VTDRAALGALVGDVDVFAEQHWGRRPLLRRKASADGFPGLLSLADVDHLVTERMLRVPQLRLVREGTPLEVSTYTGTVTIGSDKLTQTAKPDRVAAEFDAGATIVLQALHRYWSPVGALCRDLELDLTHPVQANAYVTPPTSQGFAVHHDTHDVFVLQTQGRKTWRVHPPAVELPGREQSWKKGMADPGEPLIEAELEPGDLLYLPRGFLHEATARAEVSIHLTLGLMAYTWLDVWRDVFAKAPEHAPFRDSLPVGFADDPAALERELAARVEELRDWVGKAADGAVSTRADRFWSTRRPVAAGQVEQLASLGALTEASSFRRRRGAVFRITDLADDGRIRVVLGAKELHLPPSCEAAVRFVAEAGGPFGVGDLPGALDGPSRLVLLRRLVREGVVESVDSAG
jgi:hypothetical protein